MDRIEGLVKLINSGKFGIPEIAGFVKASGGNWKVCMAAINSGKFGIPEIAGFVKASGGDSDVVAAAINFLNIQ